MIPLKQQRLLDTIKENIINKEWEDVKQVIEYNTETGLLQTFPVLGNYTPNTEAGEVVLYTFSESYDYNPCNYCYGCEEPEKPGLLCYLQEINYIYETAVRNLTEAGGSIQ